MTTPLLLPQPQRDDIQTSPLSLSILEKINSENVSQVPRWQFLISEYGIWILWALTIFIGAIAFSVTIFFLTHAGLGLYEATSDNAFELFINVLPVAWVVTFVLMALLAHYNLRHTKHGYRYAVWQVLLSSIIFSLSGGFVLYTIGVSFSIDDFMDKQIPLFPALDRVESHLWQSPQNGRMVGSLTSRGANLNDNVVLFTDETGTQWQLDISELDPVDLRNLYSGQEVHLIGIASSTNKGYFYGCGVFPWQLNRNMDLNDMWNQRQSFIDRMELHDRAVMQSMFVSNSNSAGAVVQSLCAGHSAVLRVHREFAQ